MNSVHLNVVKVSAFVMVMICALGFMMIESEDSDAISTGSSNNPLSSLNTNMSDFLNTDITDPNFTVDDIVPLSFYVKEGGVVEIEPFVYDLPSPMNMRYTIKATSVSGHGLSVTSSGGIAGTLSGTGTVTVQAVVELTNPNTGSQLVDPVSISSNKCSTITAIESSTPVTSITMSGPSSGEVGDTITITATTSPSTADDRGVTFTISSGSTRATITSQSETSTGGRCTIELESAGSITVRATASDGSGVTATKTVTITEPEILVTSVSISGSSSGEVGGRITLTATTSPSSADNRHVTWSITSGSSRATIVSQTDTTTGGRCVIELESAGSITVRATADDDSGEYASKTITIEDPTNSFTLSFNGNGGSGVPSSQSGTSTSDTYTFTIPATVPTRSGYEFDGWATSSSGSAQYQPGDRITVDPGTTRLYAVWSIIEYTCHLNFSATGASNVPSGLSYTGSSTSDHVFTIPSQTPTMSGQIFMGWATSSGGVAQYQPGQTIAVGYNSTTTLYAVWESAQLEITSTQGNVTLTVGDGFTYMVTSSVSGCTVSVTGADWLIVTGDVVSGTPTAPGTYDITVTISKTGYTSASQSFTLTVVSALGFTSVPTNGLVIVEV